MEKTFWIAAWTGKVEEVKDILRKNGEYYACTALYAACYNGHDSVVSILLAHPDIDPNLKNENGNTPFMTACYSGNTSCPSAAAGSSGHGTTMEALHSGRLLGMATMM